MEVVGSGILLPIGTKDNADLSKSSTKLEERILNVLTIKKQ